MAFQWSLFWTFLGIDEYEYESYESYPDRRNLHINSRKNRSSPSFHIWQLQILHYSINFLVLEARTYKEQANLDSIWNTYGHEIRCNNFLHKVGKWTFSLQAMRTVQLGPILYVWSGFEIRKKIIHYILWEF